MSCGGWHWPGGGHANGGFRSGTVLVRRVHVVDKWVAITFTMRAMHHPLALFMALFDALALGAAALEGWDVMISLSECGT